MENNQTKGTRARTWCAEFATNIVIVEDVDRCRQDGVRTGSTLPQALRDGHRFCGRREYHLCAPHAYAGHPDRLLQPEELRLDAERAALVYRFNDEYPMEWAARLMGRCLGIGT